MTKRPSKEFGGFVKQTLGSHNLSKTFARLETGSTTVLATGSRTRILKPKKWRGEGRNYSDKFEMNSLYEDGNGNSSNLIMKYNRQDNSNYNTLSKAQFEEDPRQDYSTTPVYNSKGQLSKYYKLNRNPFETFTLSFAQRLQLRDNLALTVQPYYYWGNGGALPDKRPRCCPTV